MDALPIALTAVCERVDRVTVNRVQDARIRRLPFQQKIGAGLTTEQFQKKVADGSVRHVGLTESIAMIADALGLDARSHHRRRRSRRWRRSRSSSEFLAVDPGYVCGIMQDGVGYRKGEPAIRLHMEAYLGAPDSYDAVEIEGSPRAVDEDSGRHPRRPRDRLHRRQLDSQGARRRAGTAHDARPAAALVFSRPVN